MEISSLSRTSVALMPNRNQPPSDGGVTRGSVTSVSDPEAVLTDDAVEQTGEAQASSSETQAKTGTGTGAGVEEDASKPSGVESFTYGALGLGHPEEEDKYQDTFYTAGKVLTGAIAVGGIISVLV